MNLLPADLLAPEGPVEEELFPDDDDAALVLRLQAYIDSAYIAAEKVAFPQPEQAVRAWALYRTFDAAYILACARPSNTNSMVPVLGSEGFSKDQRDGLRAKANEYLQEFRTLQEAARHGTIQTGYNSRQSSIKFEY